MSLITNNERLYTKSEMDYLITYAGTKVIQRYSLVILATITAVALGLLFSQHHSFPAAYNYITHEGLIYTHIYGVAISSALISFIISSCHRSKKIKELRDLILTKNSTLLNNFRHLFFKLGSYYGTHLDNLTTSSSFIKKNIVSRIAVLGISIFSVMQLVQDIQHVLGHSINGTVSCITRCESPLKYPSGYREVLLTISEIAMHLFGTFFGTMIGIFSPEKARNWFLPSDQTFIEKKPSNITPQEAGILYGMMHIVHKIFKDNGIDYMIEAGTALGKERHGGMIPWDDDIDLFVMKTDEEKLTNLTEQLKNYGLSIIKHPIGYKIYYDQGQDVNEGSLSFKFPFIDVAMVEEWNGNIVYCNKQTRQTSAGDYYTKKEWDQRTEVAFGPIKVYGLNNCLDYIKRCYGDNAMDYGFILLNHRTFGFEFPKKYFLRKYTTGLPGEQKCNPIKYDEAVFKKFSDQMGCATTL